MRTHYCGQLNAGHVDQIVTLCGWNHRRRDHGGVIFIDLRDREGLAQIVCDPDRPEMFKLAESVRNEFVLKITGKVRRRPAGTENPNMPSGEIEILCHETGNAQRRRDAAVPARRRQPLRERAPGQSRHRPAPAADAEEHDAALQDGARLPPLPRRQRLHRHRDADADQVHARRRPRLPGALARPSRPVLRPAAIAAAVQAVADGRRLRPLLPDRQVLPRRRPARRPPARIHPGRYRDLVHGRDADHRASSRS